MWSSRARYEDGSSDEEVQSSRQLTPILTSFSSLRLSLSLSPLPPTSLPACDRRERKEWGGLTKIREAKQTWESRARRASLTLSLSLDKLWWHELRIQLDYYSTVSRNLLSFPSSPTNTIKEVIFLSNSFNPDSSLMASTSFLNADSNLPASSP